MKPVSTRCRTTRGRGEPPETGNDIRRGRVRDVVRVGLDVQADRVSALMLEEMIDQNEVCQQFPACVIGNQDGAGAGSESGPYSSALVSDDPD